MTASRREFLGAATGALSSALISFQARIRRGGRSVTVRTESEAADCVLFDCGNRCGLPESCSGYIGALEATGARYVEVAAGPPPATRIIILPGCVTLSGREANSVRELLLGGASVVFESGAGFLGSHEFSEHRDLLLSCFGVKVNSPVNLWGGDAGRRRVPYVDYVWPMRAKVRDFSRVVPLSAPRGDVMGWAEGTPVALKRKVGEGTLVFLGSPLGPAVLFGDREAAALIGKLLASV